MQSDFVNVHIFDCDGVILDSNMLKLSALRLSFESIDAPLNFIDWAVEEFRTNFGRTRINHFEIFYKHAQLKGFNVTEKIMSKALLYYSNQVVRFYRDCEVIKETRTFIENLSSNCFIFVVSASDQSELRSLLPVKLTKIHSDYIYGGPTSKEENIKTVLDITKSKKIYFYGDSVQDAKAAINTDIHFLGLKKYSADQKSLEKFCNLNNLDCYEDLSKVVFNE